MTKIDKIIDKMWVALRRPANTVEEIADRVSSSMGEEISVAYINTALAILRKDAWKDQAYGWTVPHVKRGVAIPGDSVDGGDDGRFMRCLIDTDGTYIFDDASVVMNFDRGALNTVKQIVCLSRNAVSMIKARAAHTRSTKLKTKLMDTARDYEYAARKAEQVMEDLEAA